MAGHIQGLSGLCKLHSCFCPPGKQVKGHGAEEQHWIMLTSHAPCHFLDTDLSQNQFKALGKHGGTCGLCMSAHFIMRGLFYVNRKTNTVGFKLSQHTLLNSLLLFCQSCIMEVEELYSGIQKKIHPALLGAGDMEAVEALMSMTKHCKTRSSRFKHSRPLTPSSDCSEEDSAHLGSCVLQESPLVSDPCGLRVFFLRTSLSY